MNVNRDLTMSLITAQNQTDLLAQMTERLVDKGYVSDGFLQDIEVREKVYPTGLKIEGVPYAYAIPHANSSSVLKNGICLATLSKPVEFKRMDNRELSVGVSIVFILAHKKPQKHIELLKTLLKLFQRKEFSQRLMSAKSDEELAICIESEVEDFKRNSES